jgi:hypothetical protein
MDAAEIVACICETFPDVETTEAYTYTYTFFFYGAERMLPFATLATADNEHDRVSDLDRDGAYRLNIGVSRETYRSLLGDDKPRLGSDGVIDGDHDFTLRDRILPHPHYAPQSWGLRGEPGRGNVPGRPRPAARGVRPGGAPGHAERGIRVRLNAGSPAAYPFSPRNVFSTPGPVIGIDLRGGERPRWGHRFRAAVGRPIETISWDRGTSAGIGRACLPPAKRRAFRH